MVGENIIVVKLSVNGSLEWAKSIDCNEYDYASAVRVINGDIYVIGNTNSGDLVAELNDFIVVKIYGESDVYCYWTIGGNLSDFCWGAFFEKKSILIYGETDIWGLETTARGFKGYPVAVYWPLGIVGNISWMKPEWGSIEIKKYSNLTVLSLNFTVSKLLTRSKDVTYYKKHAFKLVDQKVVVAFTKPYALWKSSKQSSQFTEGETVKEKASNVAKVHEEESGLNTIIGTLFLIVVIVILVLVLVVAYRYIKAKKSSQ